MSEPGAFLLSQLPIYSCFYHVLRFRAMGFLNFPRCILVCPQTWDNRVLHVIAGLLQTGGIAENEQERLQPKIVGYRQ